jgi:hypothetical protein
MAQGISSWTLADADRTTYPFSRRPNANFRNFQIWHGGSESSGSTCWDNRVIVECKASERIPAFAGPQLIDYLRATIFQVGVLLDFGVQSSIVDTEHADRIEAKGPERRQETGNACRDRERERCHANAQRVVSAEADQQTTYPTSRAEGHQGACANAHQCRRECPANERHKNASR